MKSVSIVVLTVLVVCLSAPVHGQYTKPVYISMPSAGNLQHLPLAAAKFKGFYSEMGITNAQLVFLRGNSVNVQALVAGSVQFASAFGPVDARDVSRRADPHPRPDIQPDSI